MKDSNTTKSQSTEVDAMTPETGYAPHAHRVAESILWKRRIIENDLQVQYSSHPKIMMIFFPEIGESNPVFHMEAWECLKSQAALSKKKKMITGIMTPNTFIAVEKIA